MMNPTERQELRQEIDRQIAEVRAEIEALGESASPVAPDNAIGRVSRMDAINNHAINEGSLGRARERLEQLESALARIDQLEGVVDRHVELVGVWEPGDRCAQSAQHGLVEGAASPFATCPCCPVSPSYSLK